MTPIEYEEQNKQLMTILPSLLYDESGRADATTARSAAIARLATEIHNSYVERCYDEGCNFEIRTGASQD